MEKDKKYNVVLGLMIFFFILVVGISLAWGLSCFYKNSVESEANNQKNNIVNSDETIENASTNSDFSNEFIEQDEKENFNSDIILENNIQSTNNSKTANLYKITDKISCKNNMFEYNNIYIDEYDEDFESRIIYLDTIKNITSKAEKPNIRVKFYDSNKELILDYQYRRINPDVDTTRNIEAGEVLNISFTVYDGKTHIFDFDKKQTDGKSLKDATYYSIEDIEEIK